MSRLLELLSVAVRSLWWRIAGGGSVMETDPRDRRSLEELRHLIMGLFAHDPITYLGYRPTEIRAVGPGVHLGHIKVDFHGILISRSGESCLENVDRLLLHLGPTFSMESLKVLLRDRSQVGTAQPEAVSGIPWSDIASLLLPTLRGEGQPHALTATWGDLFVTWAVHLPDSLMVISDQDLEGWSITPGELLQAAMENLTERYGDTRAVPADPAETDGLTIWTVNAVPHLNASLVLLPDVVQSVPIAMDQMFVAVPDRGVLLFVEKPETLEQRQALLEAVFGMW